MTATLSIIGRFEVNIACNSGAQYAAQLTPTEMGGQGVEFVHVTGYAATFFSPYILYLVCMYLTVHVPCTRLHGVTTKRNVT
jgi:hypothetical protein